MRISIKPGRRRVLAIAASVLVTGAAVAAVTVSAQASTADVITVTPTLNTPAATPTSETTDPLSTPVDLSFTVTQTVPSAEALQFTSTGLPVEPSADTFILSQPMAAGSPTTGTITGMFAAPFDNTVTITATDPVSGASGTATFTWVATNDIAFGAQPAPQTSAPGTAITPLTVSATDNDAAATLTYTATGLPKGLVIDPTTGTISGKPTTAGTTSTTVTATDTSGVAAKTKPFAWTVVANKIPIKAPTVETWWIGVKASLQLTATDSEQSQQTTLEWKAANLPTGMSIGPKTGLISGRPTAPNIIAGKTYKTVVDVTDSTGSVGTATITLRVSDPIVIPNPGTQTTTVGQGIPLRFSSKDAVRGDRQTFSGTGLPPGMGVSQSPFMLYGWPTSAGTYTVTLNERGSLGTMDYTKFKIVVEGAPNSGVTGQIRLALGGKCLLDPGSRTANGTPVEIGNCVAGASARWTIPSDGSVRANGRCLDIAGTGGTSGKQLQLWSCNGSARERWAQGSDGELVNAASGVCVTDPSSSTRNGTITRTGPCGARSYEQWALPARPILASLGSSCVDDFHAIGSNGAKVDMFWCNGSPGQSWIFAANGTIRISQYPNVCLTLHDSKIQLWLCGTESGQNWTVVRTGTMSSELKTGGVCLSMPNLAAANSSALIPAKCTASDPRVHWHIE